jgi:osmotically-inducible protein OsmY
VQCRAGSGSGQSPALPGEVEGSEGINIERSNEEIARDVRAELRSDRRLEASTVEIRVARGRVSLAGEVPVHSDRLAAVAAARRIPGVNEVVENLTVQHVAPCTLHELQTRAQDILIWDPVVDESALEAFVLQGVLILEGAVDAYWKKLLLEERLSGIRGIVKVENRLEVVREGEIEDATIAKEVVEVLDRIHPDSEKIGVGVSRGGVTLRGTVPTEERREAACRIAAFTAGVTGIADRLRIKRHDR